MNKPKCLPVPRNQFQENWVGEAEYKTNLEAWGDEQHQLATAMRRLIEHKFKDTDRDPPTCRDCYVYWDKHWEDCPVQSALEGNVERLEVVLKEREDEW